MSYKVVEIEGKYAIVDENGRQISPLFDFILEDFGLLANQSQYYIAGNGEEVAIFDKDGNQISPEFKFIFPEGLVEGGKELYVAVREDGTVAIYDVNGKQVSPEEFDVVIPFGSLEKGKEEKYLVLKDGKVAVFDENWNMISYEWYDALIPLKGENKDKYLAVKDDKMAIFDLNSNQITEWQEPEEVFLKIILEISTPSSSISNWFDEILTGDLVKERTAKKNTIDFFERFKPLKYYDALGIIEITDKQGNSTAIELKYKDDLDLKKGPNTPGV